MQNINFYDPSLRLKRDWLGAPMVLALLAVAVAVVVGASGLLRWQAHSLRSAAETGAELLQKEQVALTERALAIDKTRPDAALEQRLVAMQRTLEQHQAALQVLRERGLQRESGYATALQALARQSIEGLWLTALALDRDDMALRGRSLRPELIPAYVERLRLEPALRGHSFRALDIRRPEVERHAATGDGAPSDAPRSAPTRAPYVEFSLTGVAAGTSAASTGARP